MKYEAILAILISSLIVTPTSVGRAIPETLLSVSDRLQEQFAPLDLDHNLYEVTGNADYVLRATFYDRDDLTEIEIVPKYYFEKYHPDWVEPDAYVVMSVSKHRELLAQIGEVQKLGRLQQEGRVGLMLNLRLNFYDEYERAIVNRAMFRYSGQDDYKVARFRVKYFRPISGRLQEKWFDEPDQKYIVRVDGDTYWTKKATYEGLKVHTRVSIEAAGPISDR